MDGNDSIMGKLFATTVAITPSKVRWLLAKA